MEPRRGSDQREGSVDFLGGAKAAFGEKGQVAADTIADPAKQFVVEALQSNLEPGRREGLATPLPHHASADHGDSWLFRLVHRLALTCTQYIPSRFRPL